MFMNGLQQSPRSCRSPLGPPHFPTVHSGNISSRALRAQPNMAADTSTNTPALPDMPPVTLSTPSPVPAAPTHAVTHTHTRMDLSRQRQLRQGGVAWVEADSLTPYEAVPPGTPGVSVRLCVKDARCAQSKL
ncbi:hypothetical protein NHX12_023367 [Muraenolepis orangiensis]|uniref:Uncharacterized protein n=1 Tax=Muraenolepis orangiensis TaxID=630683 RepID=A0A9Q0EQT7_9TELE|nr:hypothetical protein NHX12_023367 [Muraenolepis orangiensis]